jgi:hypothetical protein
MIMRFRFSTPHLAGAAIIALAAAACGGGSASNGTATKTAASTPQTSQTVASASGLSLTSDAFTDGEAIPVAYTCGGVSTSPPLRWSGAPGGTGAFALLMDDPDAPRGTFDHWVAYDLPASASGLPQGVPVGHALEVGGKQGKNGAGTQAYLAPCPPAGPAHHYRFRLFALDGPLGLGDRKTKAEVEAAMQGHILAQALLTGTFGR